MRRRLADDDRPGGAQLGHRSGVRGRRGRAGIRLGAATGREPFDVEDVLDREGDAAERPTRLGVLSARLAQRTLGVDGHERVHERLDFVDSLEHGGHERGGCELAGGDQRGSVD